MMSQRVSLRDRRRRVQRVPPPPPTPCSVHRVTAQSYRPPCVPRSAASCSSCRGAATRTRPRSCRWSGPQSSRPAGGEPGWGRCSAPGGRGAQRAGRMKEKRIMMMIRKERGNQFIRLTFLGQSPRSQLHVNKGFMLAKAFGRRQGAPRAISDNSAKSFGALSQIGRAHV